MTARDTIARAIRGGSQADMDWLYYADEVITAVRSMTVEEQAELLCGHLTRDDNGEPYVVSYGGER